MPPAANFCPFCSWSNSNRTAAATTVARTGPKPDFAPRGNTGEWGTLDQHDVHAPFPAGQSPYGSRGPWEKDPHARGSQGPEHFGGAPYPPAGAYPAGGMPQSPYGYGYGYGYMPPQHEKGATTSLVLGIVSFFICGIIFGPAAIIEGVKARKRIAQSNGQLTGDGMALAGIILGVVYLVVFVIAVIVIVAMSSKTPSTRTIR